VAVRVCVIVNPAAGGGKAGRVANPVAQTLAAHGLEVRAVNAEGTERSRALARQAALGGEIVAVLGGDGMVGLVADAVRDVPDAVLGVLPAGRGNDLARVLGIPSDPLAACATIAHGVARKMDVGEIRPTPSSPTPSGRRTFVGIASVGLDSDTNRIANEASPRWGGLVYAYAMLRALPRWRRVRFEIELDPPGARHTITGYSVAAANSRAYGGGMRLAPHALLDDGLLDVVAIEHVSRLRLLSNVPRVFLGAHLGLSWVHVFRARELEISADRPFTLYADGDPVSALPVRVRALAAAVRVLVPAERTAKRVELIAGAAGAGGPFGAPVPAVAVPQGARAVERAPAADVPRPAR